MENKYKEFLEKLGVGNDIIKGLEQEGDEAPSAESLAVQYAQSYEKTILERKAEDIRKAARKEAQDGTYHRISNLLAEKFGLEKESFKDSDKPFDAMIEAIQTNTKAQIEELKKGNKSGKNDEAISQLEAQLSEANKQLKTLEAQAEQRVNETKKQYEDRIRNMEVSRALNKAITGFSGKLITGITPDIVERLAKDEAQFELNEDGKVRILKDGKPYQKNASSNYEDVGDFIQNEILEKRKWIKKNNVGGEGGEGGNPPARKPIPGLAKLHPSRRKKYE